MELSDVYQKAIRPALAELPASMRSREAVAMLLAIGLQESAFTDRRQIKGPARGFWQFEFGGGFKGVFAHRASKQHAEQLAASRGHFKYLDLRANLRHAFDQLEHDDVFAAGIARLLLWTDPRALPALNRSGDAFEYYLRNWRPGAYTRGTPEQKAALRSRWNRNYARAMSEVN